MFLDRTTDLRRVITKIGVLVLGALLIGVVVPGTVAWRGNVFYEDGLRARIPESARKRLTEYENELKLIESQRTAILVQLVAATSTSDIQKTESLRFALEELGNRIKSHKSPVHLSAFYLSSTMHLWPTILFCLGMLAFVLNPISVKCIVDTRHRFYDTAALGLFIWILYRAPSWARNFLFNDIGRTVYADTNWDVFPIGYAVQEFLALTVAILLTIIWRQWICFGERVQMAIQHSDDDGRGRPVWSLAVLNRLSRSYVHWQVASIILAVGFLTYTTFFWHMVLNLEDRRYLVHAVIVHALWAFTWFVITFPLLIEWWAWAEARSAALLNLCRSAPRSEDAELQLKVLQEVKPISALNLVTTSATALGTILYPFLQHYIFPK